VRLRSSAATAALLLLSVVGAACGSGDDNVPSATVGTSPSVIAGGSTTTSVATDPSATTTTVEGGTDTTEAPATTVAGGPGPVATAPPATGAPGPVALTPAAPGVYHYATSGGANFNGTPAPFPPDTTNTVGPAAGVRQTATRDLRSGANGSVISYTFDYRPDGLYLVSLVFTTSFSGYTDARDLTPPAPLLFLATGATAGASRTLDIAGAGGSARVVVDVLGTEPVVVGGQTVDTLIVRSVATLPPGQLTGTQSLTINLDRASRLWVRERSVGDVAAAGLLTVHTEYTATLTSLTPG